MPRVLSSLTTGAKVEVPVNPEFQSRFGAKIVFKIVDINHSGYPLNSVTLITDRIIQLMAVDAREPDHEGCEDSGYNRYAYSNLHQWLNSNATAGGWYSPKHSADNAPTTKPTDVYFNPYTSWAGFLAIFDSKFVAELLTTTPISLKPTTDGGDPETFEAKFFLPSAQEVNLMGPGVRSEGSALAAFDFNILNRYAAYPTPECVNNRDGYEPSQDVLSATSKWHWRLRTPKEGCSNFFHCQLGDSVITSTYAASAYVGVRPLCNLRSSILVSDNPNDEGNYEIIYNYAPSAPPGITVPAKAYGGRSVTISCAVADDPDGDEPTYCFERRYNNQIAWTQVQESASRTFTEEVSTSWNTLQYRVRAKDGYGQYSAYTTSADIPVSHNRQPLISGFNSDLGTKRGDFTYQYSVSDPDGDVVNVIEEIDGTMLATKNGITPDETITLSVSGNTFTALSNAAHTITITATDGEGDGAVRTLTFTKSISDFVITLTAPLEADVRPTRANIKVTRDIPAGGTFKVEASNNPFDASPVWEDCTNAVIQGVAYVFGNATNSAAEFGLNIRVTVERGDALTACWVSGIGGNFE